MDNVVHVQIDLQPRESPRSPSPMMTSGIGTEAKETFSFSSRKRKPSRPRRPRRQPLYALGDRRIGTDLTRKDTNQRLLAASKLNESERRELYTKLREELDEFLKTAPKNWDESEECKRFSIFGDCITCANWKDKSLISGSDIVKVVSAMYRLSNMGAYPADRRKFEEGVTSDLRSLRVGTHAILEEANSELLQSLYRINSVRTHKRQKVFIWEAVPFNNLAFEAISRERRLSRPEDLPTMRTTKRSYSFPMDSQLKSRPGKVSNDATDSGSPRSWGSPDSGFEQNGSGGGFILYVPAALRRASASTDSAYHLSVVADVALSLCDDESKAGGDTDIMETNQLPPLRDVAADSAQSPLPTLETVLPKQE